MSIDQFTSLRGASVALTALLACSSPSTPRVDQGVGGAPAEDSARLPPGLWGGDHIRMEINGEGARLEFDCATGTIDQVIVSDSSGRFSVKGSYAPDQPGPQRDGRAAPARALYVGQVRGETMTLTVTLEADAQQVGRFTLNRGNDPLLTKCR